jgi:predicted membrane GTPase involved in stress response
MTKPTSFDLRVEETRIGMLLASARGDIPQDLLARTMRERGFSWSKPTVVAIEKGERQLRVVELLALRDVLGRSIVPLDDADAELEELREFKRRVLDATAATDRGE